ncbi:hypothetical protein B0H19DRAFT_1273723 [Mycena capillaripes]|nr:hypothetical protein B0H19DRAFT_1273723 [Mycena capillaripes]
MQHRRLLFPNLYRSDTSLANIPNGMNELVIALFDPNKNLFEASNVYKVGNELLLIVECIGTDGRRYFRSWMSTSLNMGYLRRDDDKPGGGRSEHRVYGHTLDEIYRPR